MDVWVATSDHGTWEEGSIYAVYTSQEIAEKALTEDDFHHRTEASGMRVDDWQRVINPHPQAKPETVWLERHPVIDHLSRKP